MRNTIIASLIAIIISPVLSLAQIMKGMTDLEKENLKGNISRIVESKRWEEEKWGETEVKLETLKIDYYDQKGFKLLSAIQVWNDSGILRRFNRDENGNLLSVNYYKHVGDIDVKSYVFNPLIGREIYEYDPNGNLKSITFENTNEEYRSSFEYYIEYYYDERPEINIRREHWVYKLIFRYDSPLNYTVIACDRDGNTLKSAKVSENGSRLTNDKGICSIDNKGKMLSRGGAIMANNGAATFSYFYGYNKQGDLVLETAKEEGIKQVDNAPWLTNQYKYSGDTVYEYTYDTNLNWTVKKQYKTRSWGKEEDSSEARARLIEYDEFHNIGDLQYDPSQATVDGESRRLKILIRPEDINEALDYFYSDINMFENDKNLFVETANEYSTINEAYNAAIKEYKTARLGRRVALAYEIENKKASLERILDKLKSEQSNNYDYIIRTLEERFTKWTDFNLDENIFTKIAILKNSFGKDSPFIALLDKAKEYLDYYNGFEIHEVAQPE